MLTKRMKVSILTGIVLGVFCIIGASIRSGFQSDISYLFALWYNRLLIGVLIGLAAKGTGLNKVIARGGFFGLMVSFAFYSSTGFTDVVSFLAGILYGMIIEYVAYKYQDNPQVKTNNKL